MTIWSIRCFLTRKQKLIFGLILVITFPLLTGCWDRLEIEERGVILGLAVDPMDSEPPLGITGPNAKSDSPGYRLTAQIGIPGRIPLGPGESSSGGSSQRPVWVVGTTGKTIDDAMNKLQQQLADKIFLGQLRVITVNQKIAGSSGMRDIQDFFRRNAEIRRLCWLLISDGEAREAMEAAPKLERVPTLYLVGTMEHAVALGKMPNVFLGNYWTALSAKGQDPVLPFIKVIGSARDQIETEGLAVFNGDHMVGVLDATETIQFMEIRNVHKAGYGTAYPMPGDPQHSVIVTSISRRTKTKCQMINGRPSFDVYTVVPCRIEEKTGKDLLNNAAIINQIEDEDSKALTDGQMKLVKKLQKLHADIFGFGEFVRGEHSHYWKNEIKESHDKWDEQFSKMPFQAHVKVYIQRMGMAAK
ncbi:Ger(x)C family spore germination protein [Alicyclobacillus fodiniaquatilis]|uniref:Ger(X)C family spore germination protein n=1 Tax=Alicyclobacillus fodiniaquatilis TaxID=1661150 RepID=A0ABW4JMX5_9BACL